MCCSTWAFHNICDFDQFWCYHFSGCNHCALSSGI
jgi:hypothetical protein